MPKRSLPTRTVIATGALACLLVPVASASGGVNHPARAMKTPAAMAGAFTAVSAVPHSSDVWAIGENASFSNFVVRRHHNSWKNVPGGRQATSIVAPSATKVWLGGIGIYRFSGGRFKPVTVRGVQAVDVRSLAASSPSNVWAVGDIESVATPITQLALHWNGRAWSAIAVPSTADELDAVATAGPSNVWAVTTNQSGPEGDQQLILHWNGKSWSTVATIPVGTLLSSIAASSAKHAVAVGESTVGSIQKTYIIRFNGSRWSKVPSPNPLGDSTLRGVAMSGTSAWAVGLSANNVGQVPLILFSTGGKWHPQHVKDGVSPFFNAVSASARNRVDAVGVRDDSASNTTSRAILAQYDGHRWTAEPTKG